MKKLLTGGMLVLALGFFSFTYYADEEFQISRNLDIFATLIRELNKYYVDELPAEEIINEGIEAMLSSLDPYTAYIPESELDNYRTSTTGEYGGIGAVVGKRDGYHTVLMPYIGFPAHKSGLLIGDRIIEIDGKGLKEDNSISISEKLKGVPGTGLKLLVERDGREQPFIVEIVREKITISNVAYSGLINETVGYIRLSDFTTNAGKEVAEAVVKLKKEGATKLILDLRDNPGGLLDEAIKVANVFIPKGKEVVSTRGKVKSWDKVYNAPARTTDGEIPLAVLTNRATASAAEIVSGVVQDYDRGVLVGKRTFGKGLVQATRQLPYNSQLKVTTAKYYIPSGRCIQAIDYSLKNEDGSVNKIPDSLKVAFKTSKGRTVYDGGGINPDVEVKPDEYSNLLFNIINNNFFFQYAGIYYQKRPSIDAPKDFRLTDAEYMEFVDWLKKKDLSFSSQMDDAIKSLEKMAKDERYYAGIEEQIKTLKIEVSNIKKNYLEEYKGEVKQMLEQEVVSRYYFHEGMIESAIQSDVVVLKAASILDNVSQYQSILN